MADQTPKKKRKKKRNRVLKVLFLVLFLLIILLVVLVLTWHKHTPGPAATCTTDQICIECEEVLAEAFGHTPGAEPTCEEDQVCLTCGEVLAEKLGHDIPDVETCKNEQICNRCGLVVSEKTNHSVDENGICTICQDQILSTDFTIRMAGKGSAESDDISGLPTETESGHYNASGDGYYANSVMICGDYGLEYFKPKSGGCQAWADVVNGFANKYSNLNVTAMIVPKCAAYHTASNYDNPHDAIQTYISDTYNLLNDSIITVDAMSEMDQHSDEYMFYRTDHHWTSLGAYYASRAYCEANQITPYELDTYETTVRTGFIGTLYNYGGKKAALKSNPDYTVFHYPHIAHTMQYTNGSGWSNGKTFNTEKAGYASAYIMGDQAIEIFTTENSNGKVLMVFKESYGNCYVPYMIDYYSKVIVMDSRTTARSTEELISEYGVTDVLFLNNCQAVPSLNSELKARCMN